jgi:hypothetical protein
VAAEGNVWQRDVFAIIISYFPKSHSGRRESVSAGEYELQRTDWPVKGLYKSPSV